MTPARGAAGSLFPFAQFEFGFLLGPADGRYLLRDEPGGDPRRIVVLATLGAPQRRLLRGRRARRVEEAEPAPVPTSRATLIRPGAFEAEEAAAAWLASLRREAGRLHEERDDALRVLNEVVAAHRAAAADPYARDVTGAQALVARVGYGLGEQVAHGRYAAALEVPEERRRASRGERIAPQERLAAVLGGRAEQLACEELALRARADLDAGRVREGALEARIALEAAVAELAGGPAGSALGGLRELREPVGRAANEALRGELSDERREAVRDAVDLMERALRRHRAAALAQDFTGP